MARPYSDMSGLIRAKLEASR